MFRHHPRGGGVAIPDWKSKTGGRRGHQMSASLQAGQRWMSIVLGHLIVMLKGLCWLWIAVFGAYVVRARLPIGYWPSMYRPDPKDLGLDLHQALVLPCLLFLITPVATTAILVLGYRIGWSIHEVVRRGVAFALSYGLAWLLANRFLAWYLD